MHSTRVTIRLPSERVRHDFSLFPEISLFETFGFGKWLCCRTGTVLCENSFWHREGTMTGFVTTELCNEDVTRLTTLAQKLLFWLCIFQVLYIFTMTTP